MGVRHTDKQRFLARLNISWYQRNIEVTDRSHRWFNLESYQTAPQGVLHKSSGAEFHSHLIEGFGSELWALMKRRREFHAHHKISFCRPVWYRSGSGKFGTAVIARVTVGTLAEVLRWEQNFRVKVEAVAFRDGNWNFSRSHWCRNFLTSRYAAIQPIIWSYAHRTACKLVLPANLFHN